MGGYRGAPSLVDVYRSSPSSADDDQIPLSSDRNHWSSPHPGNEYPSSPRSVFNSASDYCSPPSLAAYASLRSVDDHWSSPRSVGCPAQLVTLSALTSWSNAITYPVKLSLVVTRLLPSEHSQLKQRIPEPSQLRRRTPALPAQWQLRDLSQISPRVTALPTQAATIRALPAQSATTAALPSSARELLELTSPVSKNQSSHGSVRAYRSPPSSVRG